MFTAGQDEASRGFGGEGRARRMAGMTERRGGGGAGVVPCGRRPATVPNMAYVASRCDMAPGAGWDACVRRKA